MSKKYLISIIGTRPQYVKVKPVYDYCLKHNISHEIIDTSQHYSRNMSCDIINSLGIENISKLEYNNKSELHYISNLISELNNALCEKKNIDVLVYGDTNSTFCAALVCYKLGIRFGHVEAGARCFNNKVPEELNRIFVDAAADVGFCFAEKDMYYIENPVLCGDLEYELLNNLNLPSPTFDGPVVLTVHRKENLSKQKLQRILNFCGEVGYEITWPIHHSVSGLSFFDDLQIPNNINIISPLNYIEINTLLNDTKFIISDSGGLLKTAPFFGKRILILRNEIGRTEVIDHGYGRLAEFSEGDIKWALEKMLPDRNFFMYKGIPSEIIVRKMNG